MDQAPEDQLSMARRHVDAGRKIVARQCETVRRLESNGCDAREAGRTLNLFERTLVIFEDHLRELTRSDPDAGGETRRPRPSVACGSGALAQGRPYRERELRRAHPSHAKNVTDPRSVARLQLPTVDAMKYPLR